MLSVVGPLHRIALIFWLAGCATASSSGVANRIAGGTSPCPPPPTAVSAANPPPTTSGGTNPLILVEAVALAAAGAESSVERCDGAAAAPTAAASAAPEPVERPLAITEGTPFLCATPDGEEDEIIAPSLERARRVCAEMSGESCACRVP